MRPFRLILLLIFFIALPISLTCWSLTTGSDSPADSLNAGYNTRSSRLRAFFSFSTPSSLFPPSAVISLTNDNSTFFLARPAAFGPGLPSKGLSGRLWVGKGFGDDSQFKQHDIFTAGWEFGCSDVPGWPQGKTKAVKDLPATTHDQSKAKVPRGLNTVGLEHDSSEIDESPSGDDGTDDYLHRPLSDSNPATPGQSGEPANADSDKSKKPTHADIESLQESAAIAGKIVMLTRGGCGFLEKVKWAQRRGGIALIVGDNERGTQLTIMYAKGDTSNVTIPALFTSYTSARLLSSLVPPEEDEGEDVNVKGSDKIPSQKEDANKPVFTSTRSTSTQATPSPGHAEEEEKGWVSDVLSAVGLNDHSVFTQHEDSRRPPSSGNVEWVLVEDWKEKARTDLVDKPLTSSIVATSSTAAPKPRSTSAKRPGGDDFVIGVQDWRDADLVAPRLAIIAPSNAGKVGAAAAVKQTTSVSSSDGPESTLKGGSITPGSGEYAHDKPEPVNRFNRGNVPTTQRYGEHTEGQSRERASWLSLFRSSPSPDEANGHPATKQVTQENKINHRKGKKPEDDEQPGLWVTMTPTSVSTSPFFDTLLVLVISPLVTLTMVYALLLLRSRIRRRRWRAPKSVVEQLPVRTYHTMASNSSTSSSRIASPDHSSPTSPLLISANQNVPQRPRPHSQTVAGSYSGFAGGSSLESQASPSTSLPASLPNEKPGSPSKTPKRKRYTGRQIECVVCLEEYVDGESRVMSLPCGHEFHAECITPWLVTRRRTCPICKGDVVRSMARQRSADANEDENEEATETEAGLRQGEETSDDVQNRVAGTVNEEPTSAIPIPTSLARNDDDIERGQDLDVPLLEGNESIESSSSSSSLVTARDVPRPRRDGERQSLWRNVVSASVSRLSGDTLRGSSPVDRTQ